MKLVKSLAFASTSAALAVGGEKIAVSKPVDSPAVTVFGFTRGKPVPAALHYDAMPPDMALRLSRQEDWAVSVSYTDQQGICSVEARMDLPFSLQGRRQAQWEEGIERLVERVSEKIGSAPSARLRRPIGGFDIDWKENLPAGYKDVLLRARVGSAYISFRFDNYDSCQAEKPEG